MFIMKMVNTSLTALVLGTFFSEFTESTFVDYTKLFEEYMIKYDRSYVSYEEQMQREQVFIDNYKLIVDHNKDATHNFKLEMNEYMDRYAHEMNRGYVHSFDYYVRKTRNCNDFGNKITCPHSDMLPSEVDWRQHDAVTPVKNQGQCGSCWSFSATGAMEGAWALTHNELVSFSEQQLMDCSKMYGDMGCNGGLMDSAFRYAIDNGMCEEDQQPYEAENGECSDVKCNKKYKFDDCYDVDPFNQYALKTAVSMQPVSVAIQADKPIFQFYSSGIIDSESCGTSLDHGVLIVGYGTEDGIDYWLVKNSWGPEWGDEGYVKIARDDNSTTSPGICGIASTPSFITTGSEV